MHSIGACSLSALLGLPKLKITDSSGRSVTRYLHVLEDAVDDHLAMSMHAQAQTDRAPMRVPEALAASVGRAALEQWLQDHAPMQDMGPERPGRMLIAAMVSCLPCIGL